MKLAAASCAKLADVNPQQAWVELLQERPDVLLLLGDNIYLQNDLHTDATALAAELRQRYAEQSADPGFAALVADVQACGGVVAAIYDDHDFLGNDRCGGDEALALRMAARAELVRAFSPAMTGDEVYSVQRIGPVDLVVLDGRFYRRSIEGSVIDRNAMLGAAQWAWLEQVVAAATAPYLLLASATTLHNFGHQSWEHYPAAFERMTTLLRGRTGALLLSGDLHANAVYDDSGVIEIVSSAVARRGVKFKALRQNYALLDFADDALHVELRSLKVGSRFDFSIPLGHWALP